MKSFNNSRIVDVADAIFDKDGVNLRTLKRILNNLSGSTWQTITENFLSLSGGTVTGETNFTNSVYANIFSGSTIYSGRTNLYSIFASTGETENIQNALNQKANLSGSTFTGNIFAVNLSGTNTGDNSINTTSNSYADGKVADVILSGVTDIAPSQNIVFSALTAKQSKTDYTNSFLLMGGGDIINIIINDNIKNTFANKTKRSQLRR